MATRIVRTAMFLRDDVSGRTSLTLSTSLAAPSIMRDRQDNKEDKSSGTPNQSESKKKPDGKKPAFDALGDEDPHICRGID
jgi:hypothetical protein